MAPSARATQVILSAPAAALTFRALSFPFADRRRLATMVAGELEHSLAFPPGRALWDFVARPPASTSGAAAERLPATSDDNVFAVACPRDRLESMLSGLPEVHPTVVDAEPFAFQRVLALAGVHDALVVDFGATHTTFCRIRGGHLDYVRVQLRGGDDLDRHLAQRRNTTTQAARILKHDKGMQLDECREFFDHILSAALLPNEPTQVPIYITGGAARCRGLIEWLSSRLGRPALTIPVPQGVEPYEEVVAFGMALWGSRGSEGINLAPVKSSESLLIKAGALVAILLLLVSVDLWIHQFALSREVQRYRDAFHTVVGRALPNSDIQSLSELESIATERSGSANGGGHDMEAIVLVVSQALREAEKLAGTDDIKIGDLSVSGSEVRMRGEAGAYPIIDAFKTALGKRFNTDVNVNSTQVGDRKSFDMVIPFGTSDPTPALAPGASAVPPAANAPATVPSAAPSSNSSPIHMPPPSRMPTVQNQPAAPPGDTPTPAAAPLAPIQPSPSAAPSDAATTAPGPQALPPPGAPAPSDSPPAFPAATP